MKMAFRQAARMWGMYAVLALLSMLFVAGIANFVFQLVLGIAFVLAMLMLAFNDGAYLGEKGATLAATLEKQRANALSGHVIEDWLAAQVWKKENGIRAFVIAVIPFLVISTVNLLVAPYYPAPEEYAQQEEQAAQDDDIFVYEEAGPEEAAPVNWTQIVTRLVFMPYVFLFNLVSSRTLNLLFFPLSLVMPLAGTVGYMMGPQLRQKKLVTIAKGKRRKMRNLKVNKTPRGPKPEV